MKKALFLCLVFVLCTSRYLSAEAISLGITRVEPIGVEKKTARLVEELLQTEFSKLPLFRLVERGKLDSILNEQQLQLSGITSAESAVQAGNILNVQKVIFGSIGYYESDYIKYLLSLRLVDVEKASVEAAESIQIRSGEEILEAVAKIVERISEKVELSGRVTRIDASSIYTSMGREIGVVPADFLSVFRVDPIKDDSGRIIMREETHIANLVVEKVSAEGSKCKLLESSDDIESGFYVRKGRVDIKASESASILVVKSIPENSRVFLDSEFIGVTPLEISDLKPDKYQIEIRSSGFKPYRGKIKMSAGRSITLERELEPEIEIEDLLMLGKMPRRKTDPAQALRKSLIPGQGLYYNGYKKLGLVIPAILLLDSFISPLIFHGALQQKEEWEESKTEIDTNPPGTYWDRRAYYAKEDIYKTQLQEGLITAGSGLFIYLFSILDSRISASNDFLYPTYLELSVGGCCAYTHQVQTSDMNPEFHPDLLPYVTSGLSSFYPGGYFSMIFRGRKYLIELPWTSPESRC